MTSTWGPARESHRAAPASSAHRDGMNDELSLEDPSRTSNSASAQLSARSVPALAASVTLLESGNADAALAQLSVVHSQVGRASHKLAGDLIRKMLRLRFPSAVALELVSMGRVPSETTFIPRLLLDQEGETLWVNELLHSGDRPTDREWENVLAQYCDCLLSGDPLPAGTPAMDPAITL